MSNNNEGKWFGLGALSAAVIAGAFYMGTQAGPRTYENEPRTYERDDPITNQPATSQPSNKAPTSQNKCKSTKNVGVIGDSIPDTIDSNVEETGSYEDNNGSSIEGYASQAVNSNVQVNISGGYGMSPPIRSVYQDGSALYASTMPNDWQRSTTNHFRNRPTFGKVYGQKRIIYSRGSGRHH